MASLCKLNADTRLKFDRDITNELKGSPVKAALHNEKLTTSTFSESSLGSLESGVELTPESQRLQEENEVPGSQRSV